MQQIKFPARLCAALATSHLNAPIRDLASRVGEILADNKLPFFPDYTDHGLSHINRVLKAEVDLVPEDVWEAASDNYGSPAFNDLDAAVLIGATLLHDIAMHVRPAGFLELIQDNSRFRPLEWFNENQEGHSADRPWNELWDEYQREVRRFSDRQLADIIGEESAQTWKFDKLPDDNGCWQVNHCLIVGEFLRRHHARLAHEIAINGFPGLPVGDTSGQFPAMGANDGHALHHLSDLIGLAARSHGNSLRVCKSYLDSTPSYSGTPRPMGAAVIYSMALLRVADYLQIDQQRAPFALLNLRAPQSPVSVREWQKQQAILQVNNSNDPRGVFVAVSPKVSLSLYLQIRELLSSLQFELDHATSVLDETYGLMKDLRLNLLQLAIRRVHSNINDPKFKLTLPYVSEPTGFSADPNLLSLLIAPLYGNHPEVGIRELIQNSIDAVRELAVWQVLNKRAANQANVDLPDCDMLVEFAQEAPETWVLRVVDNGIGMTDKNNPKLFPSSGSVISQ